jgi:beta-phosphoglucomutase-like phosphatase (HAD superfamily)
VSGVLDLMGPERKASFEFVLAGDVVSKKKPDPEIYELAKTHLGLRAAQCLVIEDSRNGMLAALGAGLPCLITTSTYTTGEDFEGALRVVPELGDPPNAIVTLAELQALARQHAA